MCFISKHLKLSNGVHLIIPIEKRGKWIHYRCITTIGKYGYLEVSRFSFSGHAINHGQLLASLCPFPMWFVIHVVINKAIFTDAGRRQNIKIWPYPYGNSHYNGKTASLQSNLSNGHPRPRQRVFIFRQDPGDNVTVKCDPGRTSVQWTTLRLNGCLCLNVRLMFILNVRIICAHISAHIVKRALNCTHSDAFSVCNRRQQLQKLA